MDWEWGLSSSRWKTNNWPGWTAGFLSRTGNLKENKLSICGRRELRYYFRSGYELVARAILAAFDHGADSGCCGSSQPGTGSGIRRWPIAGIRVSQRLLGEPSPVSLSRRPPARIHTGGQSGGGQCLGSHIETESRFPDRRGAENLGAGRRLLSGQLRRERSPD